MNAEQLQVIKERAKYATDGPWKVVKSEDSGVQIGTAWEHGQLKAGVPIVTTGHGKDGVTVYINHVNAEFIAHAREDIPALIAEVERLREALQFYAKESTYWYVENPGGKLLKDSRINKDLGSLARLALAGDSNAI